MESSGVEQECSGAQFREVVLEDEVVEDQAVRHDVFEKIPQSGKSPLAIAELVDVLIFGFRRRDAECLIKRGIGGPNQERGIENEQRFADRVENILTEVLKIGERWYNERLGDDRLLVSSTGRDRKARAVERLRV